MTERPKSTVDFGTANPELVPIRDAATVVLLRDGADGIETVMLQRNLESDFVGGAYVFPGGAVDPQDGHTDPFRVAAIRETFEEAGLLLARDGRGRALSFEDAAVAERFGAYRREIDSATMTVAQLCATEGLTLALDELRTYARWVTPLGAPRRYDTRFFVARAPEGQVALHDDREVIGHVWIRPSEALDRHDAGLFNLILPTRATLEDLVFFDTVDDVIEALGGVGEPEPIMPTADGDEGGVTLTMPDGRRFDAATCRPLEG